MSLAIITGSLGLIGCESAKFLCKKGYDRELDWDNQLTIDGMRNVEFQKIIIGNKSNRDVFK